MTQTVFSLDTTYHLYRRNQKGDLALLKGALLLHNELTLWISPNSVEALIENVGSGLTSKEKKKLRSALVPIPALGVIPEQVFTSDLLASFNTMLEAGKEYDPEFAFSLSREAIEKGSDNPSGRLLLSLYLSFKTALPYYSSDEEAGRLATLLGPKVAPELRMRQIGSVGLPDLQVLSVSDILELRTSPYLDHWREFVRTQPSREAASAKLNEALWDVIGKVKPSKSGSALSRIAANIPVPIANPWSLYKDAKGFSEERKLYRNYGFVFFIQSAKEKGSDKADS